MTFNRYGFEPQDEEGSEVSWFLALITGAVLFAYALLTQAFVITKLWNWFLVPAGLPSIGMKICVAGLFIVFISRNAYRSSPKDSRTDGEQAAAFVVFLLRPWLILLIGWWMT